MSVDVTVESSEGEASVFSLLDALNSEDEDTAFMTGRWQEAGTLGGMAQGVEIAAVSSATAKVLVAWLRTRSATTKVKLKNKDGETLQIERDGLGDPTSLVQEVIAFFQRSSVDERK
jgi:hypothetical protein